MTTPTQKQMAWNDLYADELNAGKSVMVKALGSSMQPLIPAGSTVEIVPLKRQILVGDVVAARHESQLFIHRVVAIDNQVHLMGDASESLDKPFHKNDVLGIVRKVVTPRGWIMNLDTPSASVVGSVAAWFSKYRAT